MADASTMKMVITLKSGVQIKADVEDFATGASPVFGELRNLKWTATERAQVQVHWLDVGEVAAVHAEFTYDGRAAFTRLPPQSGMDDRAAEDNGIVG